MTDVNDDDPLEALLGPKTTTKRALNTEPKAEPSREVKLAALKVVVRKETEEEKAERKRQREEAKQQRETQEEREKRSRAEKELQECTAFLQALEEETTRQHVMERDGSEKPAVDKDYKPPSLANNAAIEGVGADEALADRSDALLKVSDFFRHDCYPVEALVQFVTRNGRLPLRHCEFAAMSSKGTLWRHVQMDSSEQLRDWLRTTAPDRIEIGPWHMALSKVSSNESYARLPVERYLVFDMDMCDFAKDEEKGFIRKCGCGEPKNTVCSVGCWFYVRTAVQVLTYLARKVLGAQEVVAVYSGRKGVHVFCLDECFVKLDGTERKARLARIEMYANTATYQHPEHTPYLCEFILKPAFYNQFLDGQLLIMQSKDVMRMLCICAGVDTPSHLPDSCIPRLVEISQVVGRDARISAWQRLCALFGPEFEMRFIFRAMFPRLDTRVTTGMDHLIKAPFVIHPSTKRCAVPIPNIDTWLPHMAPRISELVPAPPSLDNRVPDWVREREDQQRGQVLAPYVHHLQTIMNRLYPLRILGRETGNKKKDAAEVLKTTQLY
jgi:DNA primase small subunit